MKRIGLCGGPGSGKTTLARALTNQLNLQGFDTQYVPEYARFHIANCTDRMDLLDQLLIFENQLKWENSARPLDFLVSDSAVLMQAVYTYDLTNFANYKEAAFYCQHYQKILEHKNRYDLLFFLPSELHYTKDGIRRQGEEEARDIGERIRSFLLFIQVPFYTISGTLKQRLDKCLNIIMSGDETNGRNQETS